MLSQTKDAVSDLEASRVDLSFMSHLSRDAVRDEPGLRKDLVDKL